jgi:hypothetical protein
LADEGHLVFESFELGGEEGDYLLLLGFEDGGVFL